MGEYVFIFSVAIKSTKGYAGSALPQDEMVTETGHGGSRP